jgi:hypothetical protein
MRKSNLFFIYLALNLTTAVLLFIHASIKEKADMPLLMKNAEMTKRLELTDLALFTEARYTRHLSQADLNTPFQDYPMSFEHFPSGSVVRPPAHLISKGKR